jgi:hypothetical protein
MRKLYKLDLPVSTSMQFDNYITHIILANSKSIDNESPETTVESNSTSNEEMLYYVNKNSINNNFTSSPYTFIQSFIKSQLTSSSISSSDSNKPNNNFGSYFNLNNDNKKPLQNQNGLIDLVNHKERYFIRWSLKRLACIFCKFKIYNIIYLYS